MHLIFDFDGTITEKDTIFVLARSAIEFKKSRNGVDLGSAWDQVAQAYVDDLNEHRASWPIPEEQRTLVQHELEFLSSLKVVEDKSIARVEDCGIFAGLEPSDLFQMGVEARENRQVILRRGFEEVIQLTSERGWAMSLISVNWSRSFIQGVLHPFDITIFANEVTVDGKVRGPPALGHRLTNSSHKMEIYNKITSATDGRPVYFGDSPTDMECLLQGGVVISDKEQSSLLKTLNRIGYQVPDAREFDKRSPIIRAKDFHDVFQSGFLEP